jgi:RNA polymerase sigma factor (sigma-70 family)
MSAAPSFRETAATAEAAQAGLLYERYSGRILGFCRSRLASREEAEDAVQHTFMNAYRSLRTGTVPRAEAAWLFKIAENVCLERRRSAWRRSRIEAVSDDGDVGATAAAPERSHDELAGLADALAQLTPNQRRAILMREWQGLSYREIAAELALTEAAVETLLFRARRSLAGKLDRSRGRVWGWLDVGSALAWGKSLLGGAALKVAAATVVVATGVTVATPSLRHDILGGGSAPAPARIPDAPAGADSALVTGGQTRGDASRSEASSSRSGGRTSKPSARPGKPVGSDAPAPTPGPARSGGSVPAPPAGAPGPVPVPGSVPGTDPVTAPVPAPVPVTVPPPPAVEVPPVPPVAPLPPVQLPPPPPLPPLPPLPPVTVPSVPPPPELPKLP